MGGTPSGVEEKEEIMPPQEPKPFVRKYGNLEINFDVISSFDFPLDCLGEVLGYTENSKDVLSYLLTCKSVYRYIMDQNPKCTKNAEFSVHYIPISSKLICSKLIVDRNKYSLCISREFTNEDFQLFPNLSSLTLCGVHHKKRMISGCEVSSECFQYLPNLEVLDIDNVPWIEDEDFSKLTNLRKLHLKYETKRVLPRHIQNHMDTETSTNLIKNKFRDRRAPKGLFLKYLPKLEVLKLSDVHTISNEHVIEFLPRNQIRKIVLWATHGVSMKSTLEEQERMEHIEFFGCYNLLTTHEKEDRREEIKKYLKPLKNLQYLSIRDCTGFDSEEKEFIPNECLDDDVQNNLFQFIFKPKRFFLGRLRMELEYL